ncbi:MAG: hypothetical protein WBM40_03115 [Thiohalocapsa sp.]
MLLAPLFESLPRVCPNCGADMRLIAFVTDAAPIERFGIQIGEAERPLRFLFRDSEKTRLAAQVRGHSVSGLSSVAADRSRCGDVPSWPTSNFMASWNDPRLPVPQAPDKPVN